ncbi:MAG: CAP domain-containing protein [Actinomycetota bacterium]|nr:CAP domain-containing protein [Actinomycetota bacterium]
MRFDGKKAELLRLHNEERAERGAPALCAHPQLEAAAQGHAEDMLKRGFYEHVTPEGMDPGQRISRTGYPYATYGENNNRVWGDFAGEPSRQELREAVESWMDSPGHRKTLLNPALREVGFGITTGRYAPERGTTTMYAADFGTRR